MTALCCSLAVSAAPGVLQEMLSRPEGVEQMMSLMQADPTMRRWVRLSHIFLSLSRHMHSCTAAALLVISLPACLLASMMLLASARVCEWGWVHAV